MKKTSIRKLAGFLATCMVSSILSPAMPAYAVPVSDGSPVEVYYQLGYGPGPAESDSSMWQDMIHTNKVSLASSNGERAMVVQGKASNLYEASDSVFHSYLGTPDMNAGVGRSQRPKFPNWAANEWHGYVFKGWYTAKNGGTKITELKPAFPYENPTEYFARWEGDAANKENYTTKYQRTIPAAGSMGPVSVDFFSGKVNGEVAGNNFSTIRKVVPGYVVEAVANTPETSKTYYDTGADRNGFTIRSNETTLTTFKGKMPNEAVDVSFQYKPDTDKKFALNVRNVYFDGLSETEIGQQIRNTKYVAESELSISPAHYFGYMVTGVEVETGNKSYLAGTAEPEGERGVYSYLDAGGSFDGSLNFTGRMPNQPLTIKYTYALNPADTSAFNVNYVDDTGASIYSLSSLSAVFGSIQDSFTVSSTNKNVRVQLPDLSSYGYTAGYQIASINGYSGALPTVTSDPSGDYIDIVSSLSGGQITVCYTRDVNDPDFYAQLQFLVGPNGTVGGNISPRRMLKGEYDINNGSIETLESLIAVPDPDDYYVFEGWFEVNSSGNKISGPLSTIDLRGAGAVSKTIKAFFVKDPAAWKTVKFKGGDHVTMPNHGVSYEVITGTRWGYDYATNDPTWPTYDPSPVNNSWTFDSGYMMDCWMDSRGNIIDNPYGLNPVFTDNETYTLYAKPISAPPGYETLNRPNGQGSVDNNGRGVITVAGSEVEATRKYVVTDENGNIIDILSGQQIKDGAKYTDLNPGTVYKIYEVAAGQDMSSFTSITEVPSLSVSLPGQVLVPAIKDAIVSPDGNNPGKTQIIVKPADPNTDYALLDENGNVVHDWKQPTTNPDQVIFDNLDSDSVYKVVTRPRGDGTTPGSHEDYGSEVSTGSGNLTQNIYKIQTINGNIVSVGTEQINAPLYENAVPGTRVKLDVDPPGGTMQFKYWKVLIGTVAEFGGNTGPTGTETVTFLMPEGNLVLMAVYEETSTATPSVAYKVNSGHEGEVALNLEQSEKERLEDELTTNDDRIAIGAGKSVEYIVDFTKRKAVASESNAALDTRGSAYEDAFKAAWALDVELYRREDNGRRIKTSGPSGLELKVFAQIDPGDLGHLDYELWKVYKDVNGDSIAERVNSVDPYTDEALGGVGLFQFEANVDCTYVLTYSKTHKVKIVDSKQNTTTTITVRKGESLYETDDYLNWEPDVVDNIWKYIGLSKNSSGASMYDLTDPVTKDLTLYAVYEEDDEWRRAKEKLDDEITTGNNLVNDPNLSQEDRDRLQDAINKANDISTGVGGNRPSIDDLKNAYEELHEVIDSIVNPTPVDPDPPTPPKPRPDDDDDDDDNRGGGGGGGGSKTLGPANRAKSYVVGTDGNWELIDEERYNWVFTLTSGSRLTNTWAYIHYTHDGVTTSHYYYFGEDGIMKTGWFFDTIFGHWYYLSIDRDGWYGHMVTGWHRDSQDHKSYYLDTKDGFMITGWKQIDGQWYYFSPLMLSHTWGYNETISRWEFLGSTERPYGSMYVHEQTPDGYEVNADGIWNNQ